MNILPAWLYIIASFVAIAQQIGFGIEYGHIVCLILEYDMLERVYFIGSCKD